MHRPTHPSSPVQSQGSLSWLPILVLVLAGIAFVGWRNGEALVDWWDGEPAEGASGPAKAEANLVGIFSADDYPFEAMRKGEQGTVSYQLSISRRGRIAKCEIVQSSGSRQLDEQTCRIIERRARFKPARDAAGNRIEDSQSGRIRWELPQ